LIKVVLLVLSLLVAAASCASVPQHAGEGAGVPRYAEGASPDGDLLAGDSLVDGFAPEDSLDGALVSGDSQEGDLTFGDSLPEGFLDDVLLTGDFPGDALLSGYSPEGDLLAGDPLSDVPGDVSFPVSDPFPEVVVAEVPSLESGWIADLAEPVAPVFDPDPALLAIAPDFSPVANPNTNPNPSLEPVSPIAIREPLPVVAQVAPPAQVPTASAEEAPVTAPPIAPLEPPPATTPPPVTPHPAVAWEPPFFAPELPNPVSDFRNLLPPPIVFSRTVYVTEGQAVEVPFRGNGWIFLGETDGRRGISFDTRRPDSEGQTFVFRAETDGEYALRFYRRDFIRDIILNDHVRVIIADTDSAGQPVRPGRVVAERWPSPVDEARVLRAAGRQVPPGAEGDPFVEEPLATIPEPTPETLEVVSVVIPATLEAAPPVEVPPQPITPSAAVSPPTPVAVPPPVLTAPPVAPVVAPVATPPQWPPVIGYPYELLQMAREEFDVGRVAEAIDLIDLFRELHPSGSDEAWWLLGQFFEADSPSRNILNAISYYRRLVSEFPQSSRLTDARRRIAFLERFFINIR